jgi:ABC-type lipoprotein export system ATPase subunit
MAGWIVPAEGRLERVDVSACGWVFQNPIGVARRSVIDHVTLPFLGRGFSRRDAELAAEPILDKFGLASRARSLFGQLSGGEAQRLMLARAVAVRPDVLLVDEPTAQLDRQSAAAVIDVLGALSQESTIVVIATHDPRVQDVCSKQIALDGR